MTTPKRGTYTGVTRFLTMALVLAAAATNACAADQAPVAAPYLIEGVNRPRSDLYHQDRGLGLLSPRVLVDLESAEDQAPPAREAVETMIVLGVAGNAVAVLESIERHCRYLCGEDDEATCHYVGVYMPQADVDIGTPLAALPAGVAISNYRDLAALETTPIEFDPTWLEQAPAAPIWSPWPNDQSVNRLIRSEAGDGFALESRYGAGDPVRFEAGACQARVFAGLVAVECDGFAVLLDDGKPLLASMADYNLPAMRPLAAFDGDHRQYYLLQYGFKAHTGYGLLTKDDAGWRLLMRRLTYPTLC